MARLIYTDSSNQERSVYLGPDQPMVRLGRASDCSIRTSRQSVSRRHAEFSYVEGTFEVTDLNSSNGTWLIEDDQRFEISHERLEDGDEIWCGDFIVHFTLSDLPADDPTVGGQMSAAQVGGQPVGVGAARQTANAPMEAGVDFSEMGLDELSAVEIAQAPVQQQHLSPQPARISQGFDADDELARLRQEKQSIEDLASRQTFEITDLQSQLDELNRRFEQSTQLAQSEVEAAKQQLAELQEENVGLLEALDAKSAELEQQRAQASGADPAELEAVQARVDALQSQLDAAQAEKAELSDAVGRVKGELGARDTQVAALETQVDRLRAQVANMPEVDADSLQEELEKGKRLLSEYERRNADLRLEFDAQRDVNAALRKVYASTQEELAQAKQALEEAEQALAVAEPARQELEGVRADLAQAEQLCEDLRAEVQGLKQRVQLERRRSKEGDPEMVGRLQADLAAAQARVAELEAQAAEAPPAGASELQAERVEQLRERLGALERLTDAIMRADLDPLSTVDRIRLQSAIRETDPKKTLQGALELLD